MKTIAVALVLLLLVAMGNAVMDPYGVFHWHPERSLDTYRPRVLDYVRNAKLLRLRLVKPEAIILGSSRVLGTLDPHHPYFAGMATYNAGITMATQCDLNTLHRLATQVGHVRKVVVGLDFFSFNADLEAPDCAAPAAAEHPVREFITYLVGLGSLEASWEMLRKAKNPSPRQWQVDGDGLGRVARDYQVQLGGAQAEFAATEKQYIDNYYLGLPACTFRFEKEGTPGPLAYYRSMLRRAYANGQSVDLFIPPVHARLLLTIDAAGLWPKYEQFLNYVSAINREEAERSGKAPFAILNFAQIGPLQSEPLPPPEATTVIMTNYWDSSHFTRELGDRILSVLAKGGESRFGFPLNDNVAEQLSGLRKELDQYRQHEAATYEILKTRAENALSRPACPSTVRATIGSATPG